MPYSLPLVQMDHYQHKQPVLPEMSIEVVELHMVPIKTKEEINGCI
jgi:hypothetical protein